MTVQPGPLAPPRWPPARMFWLSFGTAVTGAILALVGARLPWRTITESGRSVEVEGGSAALPDVVTVVRGDDQVAMATLLAIGILLGLSLVVITGPRARTVLLAVVAGLGLLVALKVFTAQASIDYPLGVMASEGVGEVLFGTGGLLAVFGALGAMPVARRLPRIGMPEGAPGEPT